MLVQPKTSRWSADSAQAVPSCVPKNVPQKVDDEFSTYGEVMLYSQKNVTDGTVSRGLGG